MKKPVRFYFSFRSPYSWIAFRHMEERAGYEPDRVEFIPFWEPDAESRRLLGSKGKDFLYIPMSREKHLYILQDIKRLVAKYGLKMAWPVDKEPWWEPSHLGYLFALGKGLGLPFIRGVYRERWEEGRDISRPETLAAVAESIGLDAEGLLAATADPGLRQAGLDALTRCVQDGVFGVPFFINGFQKYWGIDRLEDFLASLDAQRNGTTEGVRTIQVYAHAPKIKTGIA
jgi:2-hydroxychromene-2-carboxylate isomerase